MHEHKVVFLLMQKNNFEGIWKQIYNDFKKEKIGANCERKS